MKQPKKYFFVRYSKGGKTFYRNQDGKKVSKATAISSKKRIFDEIGSGSKKGELAPRKPEKVKAQSKKRPSIPEVSNFEVLNVEIEREIKRAVEDDLKIYIEKNGKVIQLISEKAKAAFLLYNSQNNKNWFDKLKKKVEYPLRVVQLSEDENGNILINLDSSRISKPELLSDGTIKKAYSEYEEEENKLFKKYFDTSTSKKTKKAKKNPNVKKRR